MKMIDANPSMIDTAREWALANPALAYGLAVAALAIWAWKAKDWI